MGLVSHVQPQKKKSKAWTKTYLAILSKSVLAIHTIECEVQDKSKVTGGEQLSTNQTCD